VHPPRCALHHYLSLGVNAAAPIPALAMQAVAVASMRDPDLLVVEDVHWTVQPAEYWVVAGLQGAGKSDFLLMTGGLMPPARGDYRLFGEPMPIFEEHRLAERLRLGLVFESGQLFNHLTVWENIALPVRYHRNLSLSEATPVVQGLLATLGLEALAHSTPGALSRSWQKRVALARALVLQPEVLLLDSPLAGLDLRHAQWWMEILDQLSAGHPLLHGRPLTLVVTAADLRPWKGRACRFAVLRDRRFSVLGDWRQVEAESAELVRELLMKEAREG
jgi:ABC-type transporter Mla maintaining outer membrane lipid asymmetry ATPase subunit MlaF